MLDAKSAKRAFRQTILIKAKSGAENQKKVAVRREEKKK